MSKAADTLIKNRTTMLIADMIKLNDLRERKAAIEKDEKATAAAVIDRMKMIGVDGLKDPVSGVGFKLSGGANYTLNTHGLKASAITMLMKLGAFSFSMTPFRNGIKNGAIPAETVELIEAQITTNAFEKLIRW